MSGEFAMELPFQRKTPARRAPSGEIAIAGAAEPGRRLVQELEPADSERVTEVPTAGEMFAFEDSQGCLFPADGCLETIPSPALDEEQPAHKN